MNIFTRISVLVVILFFSSCSSQKVLNQYAGTEIIFGNGGGFTRQSNEYTLNTDGKLIFVKGIEKDTVLLPSLSKKVTADIYKRLSALGLDSLDFNHPGDRYYFIHEVKNEIGHKVVWGDPSYTVPAEIDEFYKFLMTTINNN